MWYNHFPDDITNGEDFYGPEPEPTHGGYGPEPEPEPTHGGYSPEPEPKPEGAILTLFYTPHEDEMTLLSSAWILYFSELWI